MEEQELYNDETAIPGRVYYWVLTVHKETGRPIILGAYATEEDANKIGFEKLDGSFEVIPLDTKDVNKATKMLKYRRFSQTARLEEALKRAKHKTDKEEVDG